jgi:DNA repair protein RecN (Recombination protein N)
MLVSLSVRGLLLMDHLELELRSGLGALTGETGAGKSILLDALGLCLGARAGGGLVRPGAERAQVAAEFDVPLNHPARAIAADSGLDTEGNLVLRRVLGADGRGRALLNDQPVSVGLLRQVGRTLAEIQGQHDQHGLLDDASHLPLLDRFAGLSAQASDLAKAWDHLAHSRSDLAAAEAAAASARADEEYLRHVFAELETLDPQSDEEDGLASDRTLLMHGEALADQLQKAIALIGGGDGMGAGLASAERSLAQVATKAAGRLDPVLDVLARAASEAAEAEAMLEIAARDLAPDPGRLEQVEERLFALRAAARKHKTVVGNLPRVRDDIASQIAALEHGEENLGRLIAAVTQAETLFRDQAADLSAKRTKAAKALDNAVAKELKPLKLAKAVFETVAERLDENAWGRAGADKIWFQVCTNPGHPPGPLSRIASGGELSRFLLALKVVLAKDQGSTTLIFDEVDSGVGGATADAVGERLAQLAQGLGGSSASATQVLVVTHSPQVAARAGSHWRIEKRTQGKATVVSVTELDEAGRREELARMLAGATITDEARAAADRLMAGAQPEPAR